MARYITLDFRFLATRHINDNRDKCRHEPRCYRYEGTSGSFRVCQLGDMHLKNAYKRIVKLCNDDPFIAPYEYAHDLKYLERELRRRRLTVRL